MLEIAQYLNLIAEQQGLSSKIVLGQGPAVCPVFETKDVLAALNGSNKLTIELTRVHRGEVTSLEFPEFVLKFHREGGQIELIDVIRKGP